MKKLTLRDLPEPDFTELFYQIIQIECGPYGTMIGYETHFFYPGNEKYKTKKYWLWGPEQILDSPISKSDFYFDYSIEDPRYSKQDIRNALIPFLIKKRRKKEIEEGHII